MASPRGLVFDPDALPETCSDRTHVDGCPCMAGGDIEVKFTWSAPRTHWCFWCRQAVRHEDDDAHRVTVEGREEWVCGRCWLRADVGPDVPLDYMTEGEP